MRFEAAGGSALLLRRPSQRRRRDDGAEELPTTLRQTSEVVAQALPEPSEQGARAFEGAVG